MLSLIRTLQKRLQSLVIKRFYTGELQARAEQITKLFDTYLPERSHILDVGGGWGFYAQPLESRGHKLVVLDVDRPGYQKAPVVLYDPGQPFPFEDKSFDACILVTMLHHTSDPEKILLEAKRVARKKVVVIEDVYHHSLGRIWTILRDCIYNFEYFGHPCQFKKSEEWLNVFKRLGFSAQHHQEVYTSLSGLRILNGVFILNL